MNKLGEYAKLQIGRKLAPRYEIFGCVEALSTIFKEATGEELGEDASTYRLYLKLQKDARFMEVTEPICGDLILSPTGFGNGKIKNGHVGIFVSDTAPTGIIRKFYICSNNSKTLKWDNHYDLDSWKERYERQGGFPVKYYRYLDKWSVKEEDKVVENLTQQITILQKVVLLLKQLLGIK